MKTKTFNNLLEVLELIDSIESMARLVKQVEAKDVKAENLSRSAARNILRDVGKLRKRALGLV